MVKMTVVEKDLVTLVEGSQRHGDWIRGYVTGLTRIILCLV